MTDCVIVSGALRSSCRLDLLPFYSRLVATLHPCMSDVAEDLCSMLKGDFRFHVGSLLTYIRF